MTAELTRARIERWAFSDARDHLLMEGVGSTWDEVAGVITALRECADFGLIAPPWFDGEIAIETTHDSEYGGVDGVEFLVRPRLAGWKQWGPWLRGWSEVTDFFDNYDAKALDVTVTTALELARVVEELCRFAQRLSLAPLISLVKEHS